MLDCWIFTFWVLLSITFLKTKLSFLHAVFLRQRSTVLILNFHWIFKKYVYTLLKFLRGKFDLSNDKTWILKKGTHRVGFTSVPLCSALYW